MDVWNVSRIADQLEEKNIAYDREAVNIAIWIWEDILTFPKATSRKLSSTEYNLLNQSFNRLISGEPIQYIAGHAWFFGFKFIVNKNVLIPRPETEELVDWVIAEAKKENKKPIRILDIGTGSGCIAITLRKLLGERATVTAIDISAEAILVAETNSRLLKAPVEFVLRDFLKLGLKDMKSFDLVVSNPPYIWKDALKENLVSDLRFEPALALYPPGKDPDIFYKKISEQSPDHLEEDGSVFLELNEFRAKEIEAIFKSPPWQKVETRIDLQGMPRMMRIQKQA